MHYFFAKTFVLVCLLLSSSGLYAQGGLKQPTIEFGTGISPQWPLTSVQTKRTFIDAEMIPSILPPVIKGVFTFELGNNWFLAGELGYRGLQNSYVAFSAERSLSNYETNTYIDSFLIRMNAGQLNVNVRKFRYGTHSKGLYLTTGLGLTPIANKVYPVFTKTYLDEENPDNAFEQKTITTGDMWRQWTLIGSFRAGFGGHLWLDERNYIDLGFMVTVHLGRGKRAFQNSTYSANPGKVDKATYDFEDGFKDVLRRMSTANALRQFYTEFSIRYGYIL